MAGYRGYLVNERGKIIFCRDVEASDDFTAIAIVRRMVAGDFPGHTYEVWRELELIHAATATTPACVQYPGALGSQNVMAGTNAINNRQAGSKPRYPSIGLTVTSIGTPPIKQAPYGLRPSGGANNPMPMVMTSTTP